MAYWSAVKTDVYHTCRNCTVGNNIEARNLRTGTPPAGSSKCKDCRDLERAGKCTPGVPTPAR